jgi:hypothetical protein
VRQVDRNHIASSVVISAACIWIVPRPGFGTTAFLILGPFCAAVAAAHGTYRTQQLPISDLMRVLLMLLSGVFVLAIVAYLSFFIVLNVVGAQETWLADEINISHEKIALGFVRF